MMNKVIETKSFWRTLIDSFRVLTRRQWQAPWRGQSPY